MIDQLIETYSDLIEGNYDCPDRIVLNAYFGLGIWPQVFPNQIARACATDTFAHTRSARDQRYLGLFQSPIGGRSTKLSEWFAAIFPESTTISISFSSDRYLWDFYFETALEIPCKAN